MCSKIWQSLQISVTRKADINKFKAPHLFKTSNLNFFACRCQQHRRHSDLMPQLFFLRKKKQKKQTSLKQYLEGMSFASHKTQRAIFCSLHWPIVFHIRLTFFTMANTVGIIQPSDFPNPIFAQFNIH